MPAGRRWFAVAAAVLGLAACQGQAPPPAAAPPTGPLVADPPYWCKVVPRTALWQLTGVAPEQVTERPAGPAGAGVEISCTASVGAGRLEVRLLSGDPARREAGTALLKSKQLSPPDTALPADLGRAGVRDEGTGWFAYALFWCDQSPHLLAIRAAPVRADRETRSDLTALLRLGEGLWAASAGCRLDPSRKAPQPIPNVPATDPSLPSDSY